jgi:hypothetical protein
VPRLLCLLIRQRDALLRLTTKKNENNEPKRARCIISSYMISDVLSVYSRQLDALVVALLVPVRPDALLLA